MAEKRETKTEAPKAKCDNHPRRDAVVVSTGGGVHSEIHLCEECAPPELLAQVKDND